MTAASLLLAAVVGQVSVIEIPEDAAPLGPTGARIPDLQAVAKAFYADRPDNFDLLVLVPDFPTFVDGASYEPVANSIGGIHFARGGRYPDDLDESEAYGSAGRLQGLVLVGEPEGRSHEEVLRVVARSALNRFAAYVRFIPEAGGPPHTGLLGREGAFWSFFVDTGGSILGGNRWAAEGDGVWRTLAPSGALCPLDLYLMGLIPPEEAPPVRWMPSPTVLEPATDADGGVWAPASPQQEGVSVEGAWEEVSVGQIVDAEGARAPTSADAPRTYAHGWALVVLAGREVSEERRLGVDRLWEDWPGYFREITGDRASVLVSLDGRQRRGEDTGCALGRLVDGGTLGGWLRR